MTPEAKLEVLAIGEAGTDERVGLEEYYSEAGPDYAAWSGDYNMHFGYYAAGMNPLRREAMLERMNAEVLERLRLDATERVRVLDMGCGLSATLRSFARRLPLAELTGITLVPWQIEQGTRLNEAAGHGRIRLVCGDYERTPLDAESQDAVYALESSCHAHGADKAQLLGEAYRLLRPGGRFVMADGFLASGAQMDALRETIYRKLCDCWVIETLGEIGPVVRTMEGLGFVDIQIERFQFRVAPSVFHIPWVTAKFLLSDVFFGKRRMTRARWNNVIAPALLPLVGWPLGPMVYCMVSAMKGWRGC